MKKSYEEFLTLVKKDCKAHGVKLKITRGKYVKLNSFKCGGYFDGDGDTPSLVVAGGHKDFKAILAHEYCHLTQWVDKIKIWDKSSPSLELLNSWLEGEEVKKIKKHAALCRDLELDNEIRSSKIVKKYDVGMSVGKYIKRANAYVLFYNYIVVSRKWSEPKNSPYANKRLIKAMSRKFDMNYKTLDPKIKKIFMERIYNMKRILMGLILLGICSCEQKNFKYKITCPDKKFYTDTIIVNSTGGTWSYRNLAGNEIIISNIGGIGCTIDTIRK